jgi:A/G-specific adenine glycosylase
MSLIAPFGEIHTVVEPGYETVTNDVIPPGEFRIWNDATMEVGEVACQKKMQCHEWCPAYQTGISPHLTCQPSQASKKSATVP